MSEEDFAVVLANKVLDRVSADPDDDLATLARQFLRKRDRIAALEAERGEWKLAYEEGERQRVVLRDEWNASLAENAELRAVLAKCGDVVKRYRQETPLGHQPHMIAHKADNLLAKIAKVTEQ